MEREVARSKRGAKSKHHRRIATYWRNVGRYQRRPIRIGRRYVDALQLAFHEAATNLVARRSRRFTLRGARIMLVFMPAKKRYRMRMRGGPP